MRRLACCLLALIALPALAAPARLEQMRLWTSADGTHLALEIAGDVRHSLFTLEHPDRLVLDLKGAMRAAQLALPGGQGLVKRVRVAPRASGELRIVLDLERRVQARSVLADPGAATHRLLLELVPLEAGAAKVASSALPRGHAAAAAGSGPGAALPPQPVAARALPAAARDLVVAIDAGHGGEDPGAIGRDGTREKDVTLAIARSLAQRINSEPGMRAVLTRSGDYFVKLRDRMERARAARADLFISVHADAVRDRSVAGSSVYVLSARGASNEAAKWLADRENAADLIGGVSLDDKDDVVASVLLDLSQSAAMSASAVAAAKVLNALNDVGEVRRAEVQHAGFVVLKSPDVPSMLIESAYITNPGEERRLRDPRHQARIAEAILAGVRGYFRENPPPGSRVAAQLAARTDGARVASVEDGVDRTLPR